MSNKHGELRILEQIHLDKSSRDLLIRSIGEVEMRPTVALFSYYIRRPLHEWLGIREDQVHLSKYRSYLDHEGDVCLVRPVAGRAIRIHDLRICDRTHGAPLARACNTAIKRGWKNVIVRSADIGGIIHLGDKSKNTPNSKKASLGEFVDDAILSRSKSKRDLSRLTTNPWDFKYVK